MKPERITDRDDGLVIFRYTFDNGDTLDVQADDARSAAAALDAFQKRRPAAELDAGDRLAGAIAAGIRAGVAGGDGKAVQDAVSAALAAVELSAGTRTLPA